MKKLFFSLILSLGATFLHAQEFVVPGGTVGDSGNGNVGIGTDNPSAKLHVDSYNYNALTLLRSPSSSGGVSMDMYNSEGYRWSILVGYDSKFYISRQGAESGGVLTIDTDSNVGIGTKNTSNGKLTVNGGGTQLRLENDVLGEEAKLRLRAKSGGGKTIHADIGVYATGTEHHQGFLGFKVPSHNTPGSGYDVVINHLGYVGIGTTGPDAPLTVAGNIHAREVKVTATAGGADFVFADDYALPSLEEVDAFVKANKHLPEIPSASEMEKDGLHLAEMNIKLLQKVEELTLYLIEKEAQLKKMEQRLQALEEAIAGQQD